MRLVGVFRCFECSVGDRGEVAERGVRPCRVVFVTPEGDDGPGVAQVPEAVDVEAFVAQTGVERLDVAVVPRCSGRDEYQARVPNGRRDAHTFAVSFDRHFQAFLAPQPLDLLVVHARALLA